MLRLLPWYYYRIHRHIGGLEIKDGVTGGNDYIHRHIGGLEIYRQDKTALTRYSPPHRRLRNLFDTSVPLAQYSPPHRRLRNLMR